MAAKYSDKQDDVIEQTPSFLAASETEKEEEQQEKLPVSHPPKTYTFGFTTGETVSITKNQLQCIPYLETLMSNENDNKFATVCDDHGIYMLDAPIEYKYLRPILDSLPYTPMLLFGKLPKRESVFKMLELYDFLCIECDVPSLEDKSTHDIITDVKSCHNQRHGGIHEHIADRSSARNTAASFVVALTKNKYSMRDHRIANKAYQLILFILSHPRTFRSRFRFHTANVIDRYCHFSPNQDRNLNGWKSTALNIDSDCQSDEDSDGSWDDGRWGDYDDYD